MNYSETLEYLYNSLPMYHRIGQAAYKADITNTVQLMQELGNPERGFPCIHVAGTNGKGSVSHFLASILHKAGYKVGLYTSPHLVDFRERIRINGEMIPQDEVTLFVERHKSFMESLQLSFFEMTVGLAFDYFARRQVDIAVVEVGMGGRLDSTNVVTPLLSIITNISYDHTQFLGDTLAKIAFEKAGIIKPRVPAVIGETHPDTKPVFLKKAEEVKAPLMFADMHYKIEELPDSSVSRMQFRVLKDGVEQYTHLSSPMGGWYQLHNLATLMQALALLPRLGWTVSEQNIRDGIADVITDTGLHGRWEVMQQQPLTICETAHNEDGIRCLLKKLDEVRPSLQGSLRIVYGCVNDKDYRHITQMMPRDAIYYITRPSVPRALDENILYRAICDAGCRATLYPSCQEAIRAAHHDAGPNDLVLITGSIYLVADAFVFFGNNKG